MDIFLDGMFSTYGSMIWNLSNADPEDRNDPMNLVFPKVAKCTFRRFGPSGTVQVYDGLCVLPINIFNEKIYCFLWIWFVFLSIVTGLALLYRLLTIFSVKVRATILKTRSTMNLDDDTAYRVASICSLGDWFFLSLVGANLDSLIFTRLVKELDKRMTRRTNMGNGSVSADKIEKLA